MATVSVGNTSANISGDTLLTAQNDQTVTGQTTFDRDPSAPFVVTASSAVVTNLDADKLDGYEAAALAVLAENETVTGNWTHSGTTALNGVVSFGNSSFPGTSFVPTWGNTGTANTLGNGTITGTYFRLGALVLFNTTLTWGSTTSSGNGNWTFTFPVTTNGTAPALVGTAYDSGTAAYTISSSSISTTVYGAIFGGANDIHTAITATAPFTWVSMDIFFIQGWYIAA